MKLRVASSLFAMLGLLCAIAPAVGLAQGRDHDDRGGGRAPMGGGFERRESGGRGYGGGFPGSSARFGQPNGYGRGGFAPPAGYGRSGYGQPSYGYPGYDARSYPPSNFGQPGYGRGYPPVGVQPYPEGYGGYGYPGAAFRGDWRAQQNEVRQAVRDGRHIPLGQAIAAVRQRMPGRELDAGLEEGPGRRSVYRLRWAAANGRRIDYLVDAATGAIIGSQGGR